MYSPTGTSLILNLPLFPVNSISVVASSTKYTFTSDNFVPDLSLTLPSKFLVGFFIISKSTCVVFSLLILIVLSIELYPNALQDIFISPSDGYTRKNSPLVELLLTLISVPSTLISASIGLPSDITLPLIVPISLSIAFTTAA